jgi:predicted transcriptional regulator
MTDILEMSANIVVAHLSQSRMPAKEVPSFIRHIYSVMNDLQGDRTVGLGEISQIQADTTLAMDKPDQLVGGMVESVPQETAGSDEDTVQNNKIAYVRDNDLTDPVFKDLDPWLAARISRKVAARLDPTNDIHPSVFEDKLICLEDGAEVKLLRAYLKKRFLISPIEYQDKWRLPDNYPMAPPKFLEGKRVAARKNGLGRSVRAHRENVTEKAASHNYPVKQPSEVVRDLTETAVAEAPLKSREKRRKLSLFEVPNPG